MTDEKKSVVKVQMETVAKISEVTGVSPAKIMGEWGNRRVSTLRQMAYYITQKDADASISEVGSVFDKSKAAVHEGIGAIKGKLERKRGWEKEVYSLVTKKGEDDGK